MFLSLSYAPSLVSAHFLEIRFYDSSIPILRELDRFKNRDLESRKKKRERGRERNWNVGSCVGKGRVCLIG